MKEKCNRVKKESLQKLERVLNLWKTRSIISECKGKENETPLDETVMYLGRKILKKDVEPNSLEDITITAQKLCEEYIEGRLTRSGIKTFDRDRSTQDEEEFSDVLKTMGQILEIKYPRLYTKITIHLNLSSDSDIVIWDSFNKFATHLFAEGVTWAKIIAFYAFCGGLALDCFSRGRNNIPSRIVYWFGVFTQKKVSPWIQEQGGWDSIVSHFHRDYPDQRQDKENEEDEEEEKYLKFKRLKNLAINKNHEIRVVFIISILVVISSYFVLTYCIRK